MALRSIAIDRAIHQRSYYFLGAWISILAVAGYWLLTSGKMASQQANALVAYGCAAGAVVDGIGIMISTRGVSGG